MCCFSFFTWWNFLQTGWQRKKSLWRDPSLKLPAVKQLQRPAYRLAAAAAAAAAPTDTSSTWLQPSKHQRHVLEEWWSVCHQPARYHLSVSHLSGLNAHVHAEEPRCWTRWLPSPSLLSLYLNVLYYCTNCRSSLIPFCTSRSYNSSNYVYVLYIYINRDY